MKIQYENEFVQNIRMSDNTKCVYQIINSDTKIIHFLLCMDWYYESRYIVMCHICYIHVHSVII